MSAVRQQTVEDQFAQAMRSAGVDPPPEIVADGEVHRWRLPGEKAGRKSGAYRLFADGRPAGWFQNWRDGKPIVWRADMPQAWQPSREQWIAHRIEMRRRAEKRAAREAAQQAAAAQTAGELLRTATGDPQQHAYAIAKRGLIGTRARRGPCPQHGMADALLVPLYTADGELCSLEAIAPDGTKRFLPGGRVAGAFHPIGKLRGAQAVLIGEGLATVAAACEATGLPGTAAMSASNLVPVARAVREIAPEARIVLLADRDDAGEQHAAEAARAVNGLVAAQAAGAAKGFDMFDLLAGAGPEAVRACIDAAAAPVREAAGPAVDSPRHALQPRDGLAPLPAADEPVRLIRGDAVALEPVRWVWPWYLPAGMLTILGGAPGAGKSTIALTLAATVTSGGRWPDGTHCEPGDVLIWSAEDPPSVARARLQAAGADLKRVHFVATLASGEPFDPARDMRALEAAATALRNPRLLILDPVVSAVAGDSHKNAEVRRALQPVVDLAARLGCAALGVTHFTKGTTGHDPIERVTGSLAFAALARVVLVVARSRPEPGATDEPRRLLLRAKSNVGPDTGGFEYALDRVTLAPDVEGQRVLWGARVDGTARDLLNEAESEPGGDGADAADVEGFLRGLLADGPVSAKAVQADANGAGYSWDQVKRASRRIGVDKRKEGMKGGWVWLIEPRREHEGGEECTQESLRSSHPSAPPSGAPVPAADDFEGF